MEQRHETQIFSFDEDFDRVSGVTRQGPAAL
jgi:hypothetical protein